MPAKEIRVLFLTRYPLSGASSRYRVFQYLPHLEELGIACETQSFMDERLYKLSLSEGHTLRKVHLTIRAVWRRLAKLRKWRRYDIIYMQRELFPFGPLVVEKWLHARGAVLIFDYDDALFIKMASRYNFLATLFRSGEKVKELFRLVDCTVAGNNWLRDAAIKEGGTAVTVEVAEDTDRIPLAPEKPVAEPVTIGWLGSPSTVRYLNLIAPVLREIAQKYPNVRFELMGGGQYEMEGVNWTCHDWSLEGELEALGRYDIGLMPLPDSEWSRGKSGGKARTYMAAGVPPVCTAIGYNLELIKEGKTGFLCTDLDMWRDAIETLINDPKRRRKMALAARKEVEDRFSPKLQAQKLADVFAMVLQDKEGRSDAGR